jgi:acyl-CoA thioester hydrolase
MAEFSIEKKVYYHDTDSGGVVYYANYLKFMEEARTEFCLSRGVDLAEWFRKGIAFAVVHVEVDYKCPAQYGDNLRVTAAVEKLGNSSVHFYQEIINAQKTLVKARTVWACVGKDFKVQSLPQQVREQLGQGEENGNA